MVTAVLDKMDLIVLPVFNVDGYEYTWTVSKGCKSSWILRERSCSCLHSQIILNGMQCRLHKCMPRAEENKIEHLRVHVKGNYQMVTRAFGLSFKVRSASLEH